MIRFKKVLAGMAIDEKDKVIVAYLDFLGTKLGIEEVCNFHSFVVNHIYKNLDLHHDGTGDELLELIEKWLDNDVKNCYRNIPEVSSDIAVGRVDKALLQKLASWNSDLIVLGKLEGGNIILALNVIRFLPSNTLLIPETAKHTLSHILVPVDLSAHSAKLIDAALAIQKKNGTEVKITCFHAFDPPYLPYYATLKTEEKFKAGYTARFKLALKNFIQEHAGADATKIEMVVFEETIAIPSRAILEYMKHQEVDFLIMGTHSHSGFDGVLGSTIEKVMAKNDKVPMLIIK